ncbi:MAG TPA: MurR/RpiR family transcriptional regulator [Candidatus Salinicoccus stercoripullorum]|uniref:MurR/RpiR family transcriptional regulator n=1 Tax=Candidatus Salinicoccus stercoripullorum TaxID=2838756 RepID=A0A9D1QF40_9STAP|nr:MurR/RpiR family transcriptional regulator [Candidatus Salinicoccus stercoripullorum]
MNVEKQESIKQKIIHLKDDLPRKQKDLCDYILKNFQSLGLVTIKELSTDACVGVSTVMRTIKALGYDNFNDFRKDIYDESMPSDSKWTLKKSLDETSEGVQTLAGVWEESVHLLNQSLSDELAYNFGLAVRQIIQADNINIIGTRPYKSAALYFEQLLGEFYPHIRQLSNDTETLFDKILQFDETDILVVFAFEPYTNIVINAVKETYNQNNKIILITDYDSSPVIPYATVVLKVAVSRNQFSIIPIIALIDSMIIDIGKESSPKSLDKLRKLEQKLMENDITYKS